jgi:hypothetical protein
VLGEEWTDGRHRLGVVCVTEGDEGLEQRLQTPGAAAAGVKKNWVTWRPIHHARSSRHCRSGGKRCVSLPAEECPTDAS